MATAMKVVKHPGPFVGPDAELARACAMAVIPWYGNDDAVTHQRILKDGIWNDHVAVQAALAAIHHLKSQPATEAAQGDHESGGDPTTAELLKPRGNGGVVNAEVCFLALLLVGDTGATEDQVQRWPQHWLDQAYDWAVRVHLQASDNDDVLVPVRPSFVPRKVR